MNWVIVSIAMVSRAIVGVAIVSIVRVEEEEREVRVRVRVRVRDRARVRVRDRVRVRVRARVRVGVGVGVGVQLRVRYLLEEDAATLAAADALVPRGDQDGNAHGTRLYQVRAGVGLELGLGSGLRLGVGAEVGVGVGVGIGVHGARLHGGLDTRRRHALWLDSLWLYDRITLDSYGRTFMKAMLTESM